MSLPFNTLSRFIVAFLPRSKHLNFVTEVTMSSVILEPPKIKSDTVSTVFPSISHEVMENQYARLKERRKDEEKIHIQRGLKNKY